MAAYGMMVFQRLLEQLRSEEQQVLTPVGPDMSASGFMIDILEIHGLHLLAEGLVSLIEEVGVANRQPEELVARLFQSLQFAF